MMFWSKKTDTIPSPLEALVGRKEVMEVTEKHFVSGRNLKGPHPDGFKHIYFGMGCFWGTERLFWPLDGVFVTAVGYQGGETPNPNYSEVCSGQTGHTEAVMVVFDPTQIKLADLLKIFWEQHDPTQGNRQGNDVGTQYRSAIYTNTRSQAEEIMASKQAFEEQLKRDGFGEITTEISSAKTFYFAETSHQQYLAKNPAGYCGLKGTGVLCPVPAI